MAAPSRDIDIRIFRADQSDGACRVSISGTDDRRADGHFRSPFSKVEVDRALSWMDLATPWASAAASDVRDFGKRLFEALFQGAVAGVYVASQDANTPPRFRLTVDDPVAARIPWELLVDPATEEALALRGSFVRGIATEGGARRLVVDPPLRVLVVGSAPRGLPRLDGQLEASDISRALAGVVAQGRVEVQTLEHATLSGTLNALREAAASTPPRSFHVLHWIGHGYVDVVTGANQLLFENDEGGVDRVDGARLASVLAGSEIRLVLLNACHSAAPATEGLVATPAAETTRGIAEVLLTTGIPAVVGMRVAVMDDTARRFASEFYAALADGRGVDDAVLDARILVTGRASGVSAEVGVPVAYLRSGSGQLLSGVMPLAWWQKPLVRFRRLTPLARVAVFVGLVIAGLAVERSFDALVSRIEPQPTPAPMTADLNVVVTEFDQLTASGRPVPSVVASGLATDMAQVLEDDLRVDLAQRGGTVEVRRPADAGRLAGTTPEERADAAAKLAADVQAQVVVYGSLDETKMVLQPQIYVSEALRADAEELLGSMPLGPPIRVTAAIDVETAQRGEMRRQLLSRARALAALILGMSELRGAEYDAADEYFDSAALLWGDGQGKEVIYLFRGSVAAVSNRLDDAATWFGLALDANSSYGRARMGLAEVVFQGAKGNCKPDGTVDAVGLTNALDEYDAAGQAGDQGEAVSVAARASLGMARIYLCMGFAGIGSDSFAAVERLTTDLISAYEADDDRLRELAAEAHAVRSWLIPASGGPARAAALERAEQDLRDAIKLARYVGRGAAYHARLATVLGLQGRYEEARIEYAAAIRDERDDALRNDYEDRRDALPSRAPVTDGLP